MKKILKKDLIKDEICINTESYTLNWIKDEPLITYPKAKEIIGEDYTFEEYYLDFPHMCETVSENVDCIVITEEGAMDIYGRDFILKEPLKNFIDRLQYIYDNHDSLYDAYAKRNKEKIMDLCEWIKRNRPSKKRKKETKEKTDDKGYVYVMLHQGYYKIGKSVDCMRLGEYTKLAEEPEYIIVEYVKHMSKMERKLHKMFDKKRCRDGSCEWFTLEGSDIQKIKDTLAKDKQEIEEHTVGYKRYILKEE